MTSRQHLHGCKTDAESIRTQGGGRGILVLSIDTSVHKVCKVNIPQKDLSVGVLTVLVLHALDPQRLRLRLPRSILLLLTILSDAYLQKHEAKLKDNFCIS